MSRRNNGARCVRYHVGRRFLTLNADRGRAVLFEDVEYHGKCHIELLAKLINQSHANGVRIPRSLRWLIKQPETWALDQWYRVEQSIIRATRREDRKQWRALTK